MQQERVVGNVLNQSAFKIAISETEMLTRQIRRINRKLQDLDSFELMMIKVKSNLVKFQITFCYGGSSV